MFIERNRYAFAFVSLFLRFNDLTNRSSARDESGSLSRSSADAQIFVVQLCVLLLALRFVSDRPSKAIGQMIRMRVSMSYGGNYAAETATILGIDHFWSRTILSP